jgi:hypothetical protein
MVQSNLTLSVYLIERFVVLIWLIELFSSHLTGQKIASVICTQQFKSISKFGLKPKCLENL